MSSYLIKKQVRFPIATFKGDVMVNQRETTRSTGEVFSVQIKLPSLSPLPPCNSMEFYSISNCIRMKDDLLQNITSTVHEEYVWLSITQRDEAGSQTLSPLLGDTEYSRLWHKIVIQARPLEARSQIRSPLLGDIVDSDKSRRACMTTLCQSQLLYIPPVKGLRIWLQM